jgi:hypothetical protein
MSTCLPSALGLAAMLTCAAPVHAAGALVDPFGDFLPTYTAGPANGDLDVIAAAGFFDGVQQTLSFSAILADKVGTTPGALYVWGIDRGAGTQRFLAGSPSIGAGVFSIRFSWSAPTAPACSTIS